MQRQEIQGEWWLPADPDTKLSGTLIIEPETIELALFGVLQHAEAIEGVERAGGPKRGVYSRIHGTNGSVAYTLDDCFQIERRGMFGGIDTQRISIQQVFQQIWFEQNEPIQFTEMVVKLEGLNEFVQQTGLSDLIELDGDDVPTSLSYSLIPRPKQSFDGLNGAECSLSHLYEVGSTDYRERHLSEEFAFHVKYVDLQNVETQLNTASHLQDLLTVATGRRAAFTTVSFRHPDAAERISETKTFLVPIDMYAKWVVRVEGDRKPVRAHQVLFSLDDLGGVDTLASWLAVADRHGAALSRVMISRYSDTQYISDNLLNAAAALEGYHRDKYGVNGPDGRRILLVTRLKRCVKDAGPLFADLVGDVDKFAKTLKKSRDSIAHNFSGVEGTTNQMFVGRAAAWLLILCLLRDAGAPETVFDKIAKHQDWKWLKIKMAEAMA